MFGIQSENVIGFKGFQKSQNEYYLGVELCNGGDLDHMLKKFGMLDELVIQYIFKQLIAGMSKIFAKKVLHRDLKPANIMLNFPIAGSEMYKMQHPHDIINMKAEIKIIDFGLARILAKNEEFVDSVAGTKYFWSPELWKQEEYNEKSEIWALGIMLYQLKHTKTPFVYNNKLGEKGYKKQFYQGNYLIKDG